MKFYINPEGSNFDYSSLKTIFEQNFQMISQVCSLEFEGIEESALRAVDYPERLARFSPSSDFILNRLALAAGGINYNIVGIANFSLPEFRWLTLHELQHNFGIHHTSRIESVMSTSNARLSNGSSLLWRYDLIRLWEKYPKSPKPIGLVSVDTEYTVMIPSIVIFGIEMSARLKYHPLGQFWLMDYSYTANDGVDMEEKAALLAGDILELRDVSFLGVSIPLVRMQIYQDGNHWKFKLIV